MRQPLVVALAVSTALLATLSSAPAAEAPRFELTLTGAVEQAAALSLADDEDAAPSGANRHRDEADDALEPPRERIEDNDAPRLRLGPASQPRRYATPDPALGEQLTSQRPTRLDIRVGADHRNAYFYRGIARVDRGLIFQWFGDANWRLYTRQRGDLFPFIDHFDLRVGLRTSHHTDNRPDDRKWEELSWYGGFAFGFLERFDLSIKYVNIIGIPREITDVHQVDFTLRFDDSDPDYNWSLQPYALLSLEYENQSDGHNRRFNPDREQFSFGRGIYVELGLRPEFPLFHLVPRAEPVSLAVPVRTGLSVSDYFEDTRGRDRTFGFAEAGLELTIPLASIPTDTGRAIDWNLQVGGYALVLGRSTRDLSRAAGTGGDRVEWIGNVRMTLHY